MSASAALRHGHSGGPRSTRGEPPLGRDPGAPSRGRGRRGAAGRAAEGAARPRRCRLGLDGGRARRRGQDRDRDRAFAAGRLRPNGSGSPEEGSWGSPAAGPRLLYPLRYLHPAGNRTLTSPCGDCDILERHREEKCNCTWFLLIMCGAVCVDHEIRIGI